MIEHFEIDSILYAILIRNEYKADGIQFFTPGNYSQQLGYMNRPSGYHIEPHYHNHVSREVTLTQEVLFVKKGKVEVTFYNQSNLKKVGSTIISKGDVLFLANGGHGFLMLEDSELIEVKQGPYLSDDDKSRFSPNE